MAGIEKICEYSSEHPGWLMYGYKHNHIQIMPKYRHLFKGKAHTLFIQRNPVNFYFRERYGLISTHADEELQKVGKHWYAWVRRNCYWEDFRRVKIAKQFAFCLSVPEMPGNVNGLYFNESCSISTVKRKLKKMLGCRKLNIVYVDNIYQ